MKILKTGNYYGELNSKFNSNGILFSEYSYSIPRTDWHFHENPYFMYVLHGNLYDVNKKKTTLCPPGSFLFYNWNEAHYNAKESALARGFHIEFERSWFEKNNLNLDFWEGNKKINDPRLHLLLGKLYSEFKTQDAYSALDTEILLFQLCENIGKYQNREISTRPDWLSKLLEIIEEDDSKLNLQSLSKELDIHPVHLSRAIPKYFSTTLGDYLRKNKIKKAIKLLMQKEDQLVDIAYECGFSDHSHFSRTFKSYMGMSPRDFRKKISEC